MDAAIDNRLKLQEVLLSQNHLFVLVSAWVRPMLQSMPILFIGPNSAKWLDAGVLAISTAPPHSLSALCGGSHSAHVIDAGTGCKIALPLLINKNRQMIVSTNNTAICSNV